MTLDWLFTLLWPYGTPSWNAFPWSNELSRLWHIDLLGNMLTIPLKLKILLVWLLKDSALLELLVTGTRAVREGVGHQGRKYDRIFIQQTNKPAIMMSTTLILLQQQQLQQQRYHYWQRNHSPPAKLILQWNRWWWHEFWMTTFCDHGNITSMMSWHYRDAHKTIKEIFYGKKIRCESGMRTTPPPIWTVASTLWKMAKSMDATSSLPKNRCDN